jgi:UDP-glucuronate decarboxylase
LDDVRFAVTGATGWLGRAACEVLAGGPLQAFASRARTLELDAGVTLDVRPLEELATAEFDVLLHYAYVTREQIGEDVEAYIAANFAITATVLDAVARVRPRAVVFASSGAVVNRGTGRLATDLTGDPYGTLKHLDELAFRRAAADAGARALVLRVYNVAGPWIRKPEAFALSDLVRQAQAGGPLVIRAKRPVLRSYVDVEDLARIAVGWALDPAAGDDLVVETAGDEVVEVGELATRVARVVGVPDMPVERTLKADAAEDRYVGDGAAFTALASRLGIPLRSLDEQIART